MIDGILIVDKELGITSYDVIRKVKKIVDKGQKIGHAGTLDPLATGILLILLGKGTKLFNRMHSYEKVYEVDGEFGFSTDTQDMAGEVVSRDSNGIVPSIEEIKEAIEKNFLGEISQLPPNYSAKKIKGEKAYDLAREGREINLESVKVTIHQFEIYEYSYPRFKCKVRCSSGTYIRTLINDLGLKLNTYATTTKLRRVLIGDFNVSEAVPSKDIIEENRENVLKRVINV